MGGEGEVFCSKLEKGGRGGRQGRKKKGGNKTKDQTGITRKMGSPKQNRRRAREKRRPLRYKSWREAQWRMPGDTW